MEDSLQEVNDNFRAVNELLVQPLGRTRAARQLPCLHGCQAQHATKLLHASTFTALHLFWSQCWQVTSK